MNLPKFRKGSWGCRKPHPNLLPSARGPYIRPVGHWSFYMGLDCKCCWHSGYWVYQVFFQVQGVTKSHKLEWGHQGNFSSSCQAPLSYFGWKTMQLYHCEWRVQRSSHDTLNSKHTIIQGLKSPFQLWEWSLLFSDMFSYCLTRWCLRTVKNKSFVHFLAWWKLSRPQFPPTHKKHQESFARLPTLESTSFQFALRIAVGFTGH